MEGYCEQLNGFHPFHQALSRNSDFELPLLSVSSLLLDHILSAAAKFTVQTVIIHSEMLQVIAYCCLGQNTCHLFSKETVLHPSFCAACTGVSLDLQYYCCSVFVILVLKGGVY